MDPLAHYAQWYFLWAASSWAGIFRDLMSSSTDLNGIFSLRLDRAEVYDSRNRVRSEALLKPAAPHQNRRHGWKNRLHSAENRPTRPISQPNCDGGQACSGRISSEKRWLIDKMRWFLIFSFDFLVVVSLNVDYMLYYIDGYLIHPPMKWLAFVYVDGCS
jgi:hypothetical protein